MSTLEMYKSNHLNILIEHSAKNVDLAMKLNESTVCPMDPPIISSIYLIEAVSKSDTVPAIEDLLQAQLQ